MRHLSIYDMTRGIVDAFSVRVGEQIRTVPGVRLKDTPFIVMLAPVPAMPQPCAAWAIPQCVIGAQWSEGEWHWMQIAPNTKDLIGEHLEKNGAKPGEWHALLVQPAKVHATVLPKKPRRKSRKTAGGAMPGLSREAEEGDRG